VGVGRGLRPQRARQLGLPRPPRCRAPTHQRRLLPLPPAHDLEDETALPRRPDWLEGIVALPDQLFYNTGINTYIWIVTNRKARKRKGKVQLVNAVALSKMRKSLGNKRNELLDRQIEAITRIYSTFADSENSKIFDNEV
jgi:hypothetical protein